MQNIIHWFGELATDNVFALIKSLDWIKIISAAIVPIFGALFLWWKGGMRWIFNKYAYARSIKLYTRAIRKDISLLPVIGRRQGFDLEKVYVSLDIGPSDLMIHTSEQPLQRASSFVLVGGPGAGKSTYVKNLTLARIKSGQIPFFLRLREKPYSFASGEINIL